MPSACCFSSHFLLHRARRLNLAHITLWDKWREGESCLLTLVGSPRKAYGLLRGWKEAGDFHNVGVDRRFNVSKAVPRAANS